MELKEKNIYIIGQGIAGSVLAFLLDQEGYSVHLIDDGNLTSSSMVAGGMWNPVSFKRMSQSWKADTLLPIAETTYRKMESDLKVEFFHPMELVKLFPDNQAANNWDALCVSAELGHYLTSERDEDVSHQFKQPHGHGILKHSGWLDMPLLLKSCKAYFEKKGMLTVAPFTEEWESKILQDGEHTLIIYATGTSSTDMFSDRVQIIPNKGEVLTIKDDTLQLSRILIFSKFLLPLGKGLFRLGATYNWNKVELGPTEEGRQEILSQFYNHYPKEVEVVGHQTGYRPTTRDRFPIIGLHPDNPQKAIFNGFGSKGVMSVPFFAQHFISYLNGETSVMREVDVMRYFKKK